MAQQVKRDFVDRANAKDVSRQLETRCVWRGWRVHGSNVYLATPLLRVLSRYNLRGKQVCSTTGEVLLFNKYTQPSKAASSLATSWQRTAFSCSSAKQRCIPETVHVALLLSRVLLTKPRLFQDKHKITRTATMVKCMSLCFTSHCGGTVFTFVN